MFKSLFKKRDEPGGATVVLLNPNKGEVIKLEEVPDMMFSQKILGEGFAVEPLEGYIYSPVDGLIKTLSTTLNTVTIETEEGLEILIHIGIDTFDLNGKGFISNIKPGDQVRAGDLLMIYDIGLIKGKGKSPITPIIITNMDEVEGLKFEYGFRDVGEKVLTISLK